MMYLPTNLTTILDLLANNAREDAQRWKVVMGKQSVAYSHRIAMGIALNALARAYSGRSEISSSLFVKV